MKKTLLSMAALALLAGCSLAPTYERPAAPAPTAWPTGPSYKADTAAADAKPVADVAWREFFADARLRQVLELALANNRDLRVSILNIEKARATYGIERAALIPTLSASGGQTASRVPKNASANGEASINRQYTANLGVSAYELDFFGRVRNLNEAAWQEVLRTTDNRRSVQLSLVAEVTNAWLTLAADEARLALARETLRSREASYALTERTHRLGATSGLVLAQNQTTVETARADVAAYTSQVARDRNALQLLVGSPVPPALLPPAGQATPPALQLLAAPAQLPSSVLLARPDVMAAERSLQATYANIGAARAAFFPSISLTASLGTASNELSGLFGSGNTVWSFVPQIRLPIFDGGRNQANLEVAEANQRIALAQYEKVIQTAFREAADALAERATLADRIAAQQALLTATERVYNLSDARFKAGADSYLAVLDAQRSLYAAQQTLLSLQLAEQVNRITLYKVLGGG